MGPWLIPLATTAIGLAGSYFMNKNSKGSNKGTYDQVRTGTPEASRFQKQLFESGGGLGNNPTYQGGNNYLQDLFSNNPDAMNRFQEPYIQNFNERIAPDIANRFAGMGTGNSGLSSSGFQQTLAQAGRGLQTDLASMREQQRMQGANSALAYSQQPITNQMNAMEWSPYATTRQAKQPGSADAFAQLAPGMMQMGMNGLQNYYNGQQSTVPSVPSNGGGMTYGGSYNPNIPMGR